MMGRLCLNGFISETQYEAGVKYRTGGDALSLGDRSSTQQAKPR